MFTAEVDDGNLLYEGDIVISKEILQKYSQTPRRKRAVSAFEFLHWTEAEGVPYRLHDKLNGQSCFHLYH